MISFSIGYIITRTYTTPEINWLLDSSSLSSGIIQSNEVHTNLLNLMINTFIDKFKIINDHEIRIFYTWTTSLIYAIFGSLVIMNIFLNNKFSIKWNSILILFLTGIFISSLGLVFNSFRWVFLFSLWLIYVHGLKQNELDSNTAIFVINNTVLAGCFFDINFLIVSIAINLIAVFVSYRTKKEDATNYNVLMFFSTLLLISLSLRNELYIGFIVLAVVITIYSGYFFYKSSQVAKRVNKRIDDFMFENANWILLVSITSIAIASVIYFLSDKNFKLYYDIWIISSMGTPPVILTGDSIKSILINILFWLMNIGLFIFSIYNVKLSFSRDIFTSSNTKRKMSSPHLDWPILSALLFWNPISSNLLSIFQNFQLINFVPDFSVLFVCLASPVLLVVIKYINQSTKINYSYFIYMGIILSIMTSVAVITNV
ncbi:MAG: hypothetical protein ACRC4L_04210 [Mycoplasma sp.]